MALTIALTAIGIGAAAPAYACKPIVVVPEASQLPAPWQEQMSVLENAVQDADQPWGCSGATLMVTTTSQGGVLTVARSGAEVMTRPLGSPSELVPQAKALLASAALPLQPPASAAGGLATSIEDGRTTAPVSAEATASAPAVIAGSGSGVKTGSGAAGAPGVAGVLNAAGAPSADAGTVEQAGPRAFVDATGLLRYAGSINMLTSGAALRGSLPFGRWEAALQGSFTTMVVDPEGRAGEVSYSEMGISLGGGYALIDEPVRLTAGLSARLLFLELEIDQGELNEAEASAADLRLGGELRLAIPVGSLLRILFAAETEIAPMSLRSGGRRLDPDLPPLAPYTVGLASGLGVAIP